MPIEAVVFDLDETLVDTAILRGDRDARDWGRVKARLSRARQYEVNEYAVHELPRDLRSAGLKVGVLTHSPEWYAKELLDRFRIPADALVTGSAGFPQKPDPSSLRAIATELGVPSEALIYVGDLATDSGAAAAAGSPSIGVCWAGGVPIGWQRSWPDVAVSSPEYVLRLDQLDRRGPLAEVILAGHSPLWHWGSAMRLNAHHHSLGRYFTTTDVDRHPHHALSQLVLAAKAGGDASAPVVKIFETLCERPSWRATPPQLVVSVPPKPGEPDGRFAVVRAAIAAKLDAVDGADVLEMRFDVPDYKSLTPESRRHANVDRFCAREAPRV